MPLVGKAERKKPVAKKKPKYALDAPQADDRRRAAKQMIKAKDGLERIGARLKVEADPTVQQALYDALVEMGHAAALDQILEGLRSPVPAIRNLAITAAQQLPEPLEARIDGLLSDPDKDIRIYALMILQGVMHSDAANWVIRHLGQEEHPNVIGSALEVLAEIGSPDMLPNIDAAIDRHSDLSFIAFSAEMTRNRIQGRSE